VAGHARRHDAVGDLVDATQNFVLVDATQNFVHDALTVNGHREGLAHFLLLERFVLQLVHGHVPNRGAIQIHQLILELTVLEAIHVLTFEVDHVHFTILELAEAGEGVANDQALDAIQGRLTAPISFVGGQADLLLGQHFRDLERTGANHLGRLRNGGVGGG